MKKEKIYECEVERLHQINGQRFWKWILRPASDVNPREAIRCCTCKRRVRLHRQRSTSGPRDHVEHTSREDSEQCPQGFYFLK